MPANSPQELHAIFVDAFNRADLDALVALYESAAVLVTGGKITSGHAAIRQPYQRILSNGGHMELETCHLLESGDGLALLHAAWKIHRDGSAISGLSTEVARRQPDGGWLFVFDEPRTSAVAGS
jgi:ketosteroid isomerase-like protein